MTDSGSVDPGSSPGNPAEKRCVRCKEIKPLESFSCNRRNKRDGRSIHCKPCMKVWNDTYYRKVRKDKDKWDARTARKLRRQKKTKDYVAEYLRTHPCTDCGESDIVVLEFDHLGDKDTEVSTLVSHGGVNSG